jgi:hypothetical protein
MIEKHQSLKRSSTSIRPYFDPGSDNMGLQKYGLVVYDGVFHEEPMACIEFNGVKRYLNGLNEFAPEIRLMEDPEEKAAKIKEIRSIVSELEKQLASNVVDPTDELFWDKVKLLKPDNDNLWGKIYIRVGNDPVHLEPLRDPYDLIKLRAIEDGGFSLIAKSLSDARGRSTPPKFYLDKQEDTAAIETELSKLRNKAGAELQKLYDSHSRKLLLVMKVLDVNSMQYKKSTPNDVVYQNADKFINGELTERDKRKTAKKFLEIAGLDQETLTIRAIVKDATYLRLIHTKPDGMIYHVASTSIMGKNVSEVVEYLKNPLHEDILKVLQQEVEKYWNQ